MPRCGTITTFFSTMEVKLRNSRRYLWRAPSKFLCFLLVGTVFAFVTIGRLLPVDEKQTITNDGGLSLTYLLSSGSFSKEPVVIQRENKRPIVEPSEYFTLNATGLNTPTVAMCTIIKEDLHYLNEWIDYNVMLGINSFFLYDNHDNATLADYLDAHRPGNWRRYILVTHWPGEIQQGPAMNNCGMVLTRAYGHKWAAFFDNDEFLYIDEHSNIVDFLKQVCPHGSVCFNLYRYGPDFPYDAFEKNHPNYTSMEISNEGASDRIPLESEIEQSARRKKGRLLEKKEKSPFMLYHESQRNEGCFRDATMFTPYY